MLRTPVRLLLALSLVVALAACGADDDPAAEPATESSEARPFEGETLTVASWSGPYARSFRDIIVPSFEEETGATVRVVEEWAEIVDKILAAPEDDPPFDVTVAEAYTMCYAIMSDALQAVDWDDIPRTAEISQDFLDAPEDCQDPTYGVPFGYGYSVLGYDASALSFEPDSWEDLWRDEVAGAVALDQGFFNSAIMPAALILGHDPAQLETDSPEADAIFAKTAELDVALWYSSGAQMVSAFQTGDVSIAQMYIENAEQLSQHSDDFRFILPTEGTTGWMDWYSIVRGTQQTELAEAFLNHVLDPALQTEFAAAHMYYMSNENYEAPEDFNALFADADEIIRLMDFDVWVPHFFDETGMYTRFQSELLGQ